MPSVALWGQDSLVENELKTTVYLESYYAYDFDEPPALKRLPFLFNYARHNALSLNLARLQSTYTNGSVRASLGFQGGTYVQDNLAQEPVAVRYISRADVGVPITKNKRWWTSAGIMPSHLGFESAVGVDNATLSRSLAAENSPYYSCGLALSREVDTGFNFQFVVLNGWQRIQRVSGSTVPSLGTQWQWKGSTGWTFNYGNFFGTDHSDDRFRHYHNTYIQLKKPKGSFTVGLNLGWEESVDAAANYYYWINPTIIGQINWTQKWSTSARLEYFQDDGGRIIFINPNVATALFGTSANVDYSPNPWVKLRMEYRYFHSDNFWFKPSTGFFYSPNTGPFNNSCLTLSLCFKLNVKAVWKNVK